MRTPYGVLSGEGVKEVLCYEPSLLNSLGLCVRTSIQLHMFHYRRLLKLNSSA